MSTLFDLIVRATLILVLLNLKAIIRWKQLLFKVFDNWIDECRTAARTVVDDEETIAATPPQPSENCTPPIMATPRPVEDLEENADTRGNEITPQQQDDTAAAAATAAPSGITWGRALYCTQPLPPPANVIIAANFSYPPPPKPEYCIGPAIFDIYGPPPLACCVAFSKFSYPPPPLLGSRQPYPCPPPSRPSPDANPDSNRPVIRWSEIVPVSISPKNKYRNKVMKCVRDPA